MSETNILRNIMKGVSMAGLRVFRNNCGIAYHKDGSVVRYGLTKGSSDLIGLMPVTVTPDMVGRTVAVFVAIEVKMPRCRPTDGQADFLSFVRSHGGISVLARSMGDVMNAVQRWKLERANHGEAHEA